MQKTRRMLSNLNIINLILAGALLLFLNYAVLPVFGKTTKISLPVPKSRPAARVAAPEKPGELKTPSPADYVTIAEQNLFHPERKIPIEKKDAASSQPKPEFVLYGTLLTDDLQIAYMEDKKAPQSAPTRGKKQIPVRLGEPLSGFTLKEIEADKVVMVKGEEKVVVLLNDPKIREVAAVTPPSPVAPTAAPGARAADSQPTPQRDRRTPGAFGAGRAVQHQGRSLSDTTPEVRQKGAAMPQTPATAAPSFVPSGVSNVKSAPAPAQIPAGNNLLFRK